MVLEYHQKKVLKVSVSDKWLVCINADSNAGGDGSPGNWTDVIF